MRSASLMPAMLTLGASGHPAPSPVRARITDVPSYFDLSAANERLADLRPVLEGLRRDRETLVAAQRRLAERSRTESLADGEPLDDDEREELEATVGRMQSAVGQIDAWGVTLRDIASGLIDFPALANGRPIWLCWRLGEGDIAWWHELDAGVAGRRPLIELE
jgi:hypothetical protein